MAATHERTSQRLTRWDERLLAFGASTDRAGRETNEDHCTLQLQRRPSKGHLGTLAVVADGMGGGAAGRTASELTVTALVEGYFDGASDNPLANLQDGVNAANSAVAVFGANARRSSQVGSTVAAAAVVAGRAYLAGVGDSRVYLVRGGSASPITRDHTWANQQIESGRMSPVQARQHPNGPLLTHVLGQNASPPIPLTGRPDGKFSFQADLQPGDALVLCTDGVYAVMPESEIAAVAAGYPAAQAARELTNRARQRGTTDNATAVVIQYSPGRFGLSPQRWLIWIGAAAALLALVLTGVFAARLGGSSSAAPPSPAPVAPASPMPGAAAAISTAPVTPSPEATSATLSVNASTSTALPPTDTPTSTPTRTPMPPSQTPTRTPVPPVTTPAGLTDTPLPPTNTPMPAASTPLPPTSAPPATDTPLPTQTPSLTPIPEVRMPDVSGQPSLTAQRVVQDLLRANNRSIPVVCQEDTKTVPCDVPGYTVISTIPKVNERLDTDVSLVILGVAPPKMPPLEGKTVREAVSMLGPLGVPAAQIMLQQGGNTVGRGDNPDFAAFLVVSSIPGSDNPLRKGELVYLDVRRPE